MKNIFNLYKYIMFSGSLVNVAQPEVVRGGDGFHIWRAVGNMLIKQLKDSQQGTILQLGG
jgi:hypothetical protein